jgi:hypothetical protein
MINFRAIGSKREQFRKNVMLGDKANSTKAWDVAERYYRDAVNIDKTAWWIWVQLGHSLKEQGKLDLAKAAYLTALKTNANEPDIHLQLGHLYKLQGAKSECLASYSTAATLGVGTQVAIDALFELCELGSPLVPYSFFQPLLQPGVPSRVGLLNAAQATTKSRIANSILFDEDWYTYQYGSFIRGQNALEHYVSEGEALGFCPNPLFDSKYFRQNNHLMKNDENALERYIRCWATDLCDPHPLFKMSQFMGQRDALISAGSDPLSSLLMDIGDGAGVARPYSLFDSNWYLQKNLDVLDAKINAMQHFLTSGYTESRDPHPLFSIDWYYRHNPKIKKIGMNPLIHFELFGSKTQTPVHPLFDSAWYSKKYLHNDNTIHPVLHYLNVGWKAGYDPHPMFSTTWYLHQNGESIEAPIDPLTHFLRLGWKLGFNPSPFFDMEWYSENNVLPDGENPLLHYLTLPDNTDVAGHPIVDVHHYRSAGASVGKPLIHYIDVGYDEGRSPSGSFPSEAVSQLSNKEKFAHKAAIFSAALSRQEFSVSECAVTDSYFDWLKYPGRLEGENVCLFTSYLPEGRVNSSTSYYMRSLSELGYKIILIAACDGATSISGDDIDFVDGVIVRDNIGLDFASWALALTAAPMLWKSKRLLLTNDSIFGPINKEGLKKVLDDIAGSGADVGGLTNSFQVKPHIQSYFFVLQNEALVRKEVRNIWQNVRAYEDKNRVIGEYELGLWDKYAAAGLRSYVQFPSAMSDAELDINPTLHRWRELIEEGFPFLKVQLLRDTGSRINCSGWEMFLEDTPLLLHSISERLNSRGEVGRKRKL